MAQAFKATNQTTPLPSDEEQKIAAESSRLLAAIIGSGKEARIRVVDGE